MYKIMNGKMSLFTTFVGIEKPWYLVKKKRCFENIPYSSES